MFPPTRRNQTEFEIARDLVTLLRQLAVGESVNIQIDSAGGSYYHIRADKDLPEGPASAAMRMANGYNSVFEKKPKKRVVFEFDEQSYADFENIRKQLGVDFVPLSCYDPRTSEVKEVLVPSPAKKTEPTNGLNVLAETQSNQLTTLIYRHWRSALDKQDASKLSELERFAVAVVGGMEWMVGENGRLITQPCNIRFEDGKYVVTTQGDL